MRDVVQNYARTSIRQVGGIKYKNILTFCVVIEYAESEIYKCVLTSLHSLVPHRISKFARLRKKGSLRGHQSR